MRRFTVFVEGVLPTVGEVVALPPDASRHLVAVLRARRGDGVTLLNGTGSAYSASVTEASAQAALLTITGALTTQPPPRLTLVQAVTKGKTMDEIVQNATAIGVGRIVPVLSRHCEVKLDAAKALARQAQWLRAATEACKQSGNPWRPEVSRPLGIQEWLQRLEGMQTRIVASLQPDALQVGEVARQLPPDSEPILLVGPEGDFSAEEYAEIDRLGFVPARLGPHVLRSELAATVLLSIISGLRATPADA